LPAYRLALQLSLRGVFGRQAIGQVCCIFKAGVAAKMYLMYVDESGDTGLLGSPIRYFVLTGMVIHELRWHQALEQLVNSVCEFDQLLVSC
jgi:hypothetical protein